LVWVLLRRRDLSYLWAVAAAGGLLINHQVLTGLQIENFHWRYVLGPVLSLLVLLLVWDELWRRPAWRRPLAWALVLACVAQVASAAWLRAVEACDARLTRMVMADYQRYRDQRERAGSPRLAPNSVIAGDASYVDFAAVLENVRPLEHYTVLFSHAITNAEWEDRIALNAYLLGQDRRAFRAEQEALLHSTDQPTASRGGVWGPWVRNPRLMAERVVARTRAFDAVRASPSRALDRFHVRYVAVPGGHAPPPGAGWARMRHGPSWDLYERGQVR
jgi:hypothetical protein